MLLGMLGITFHIGVRSTRPGLYTETFGSPRWRFMTSNQVAVPAQINGRRAHIVMSREFFESPTESNTTSDESRVQRRVLSQRRMLSTSNPQLNPSAFTFNIHGNWSLGSTREAEVAGTSCTRAAFNERSIGTSTRSIRGISEAGPGNNTNSEQVTSSGPVGDGSRPSSLSAQCFSVLVLVTYQTQQSGCHLYSRGMHLN